MEIGVSPASMPLRVYPNMSDEFEMREKVQNDALKTLFKKATAIRQEDKIKKSIESSWYGYGHKHRRLELELKMLRGK